MLRSEERYARQIMLPEIGAEGQEKLGRARVLIVGVGGLGSPSATYLCGAGVGTLGLVDDDVVSESNLQRQVLYGEAVVGQPKVLKAKERLSGMNGRVQVETYPLRLDSSNAAEIIGKYDLVVDGCDNFATRYLVDDTCAALGKPYIYGAVTGFEGQVSVFNCPGGMRYRDLFPDEEQLLSMPRATIGVVGALCGVVGSVQAAEALKLICGYGEALSGKIWHIDLRTMESGIIRICADE